MVERRTLRYSRPLDGCRGVAIALVVVFHAFDVPNGALGVDLFFVLSGFLITVLLLQEHSARGRVDLSAFYRRRALRLLPALTAALLLFALAEAAFQLLRVGDPPSVHSALVGVLAGAGYVANLLSTHSPTAMPSGLEHLWSLAEEEQFYLLWPATLAIALRWRVSRRAIVTAVLVGLALLVVHRAQLTLDGAPWRRLYFAPDTHADPILIGCLFGLVFPKLNGRHVRALEWASPVALLIAGVTIAGTTVGSAALYLGLQTVFAIACGVFVTIAAVGGLPAVTRTLGWKPLVYLGRISYGLYLVHVIVLNAFGRVEPLVAVPLAVAAAAASRKWIEEPFLRRRHHRPETPIALPAATAAAPS